MAPTRLMQSLRNGSPVETQQHEIAGYLKNSLRLRSHFDVFFSAAFHLHQ